MKNVFKLFAYLKVMCILLLAPPLLQSCATSNATTTLSNGVDITKYRYVVFGDMDKGDAELDDIILEINNELSFYLKEVNGSAALDLLNKGEHVLSPRVSVKTEKWDGGYTYMTISFFDFATNKLVAVIKSKGQGLTIAEDQELAIKALRKELDKRFLSNK